MLSERVRCTSVYRADAGQIQVFEVVQNKSAARLVGSNLSLSLSLCRQSIDVLLICAQACLA